MGRRKIIAQRGRTLRCRGWRQEAILRLLENNLENAENPAELVIYMSVAKAARDWGSYDRIVAALERLEAGETLVMQSGKPIGIFATRADGPLVVMASGNLVPAWSSDDHVNDFVRKGLTIVPLHGRRLAVHRQPGHRARHVRDILSDAPGEDPAGC
jgi:urocanate hydratase